MRHSIIRILLPLCALALAAVPVGAQTDTVPEQAPRRGGISPIAGVRMGWPQKLSAYVGVGFAEKRFEGGYTGWALTVEPGLGGGAIGIGYTTTGGLGMTARRQLTVLRTWGDPWMVGPDQTYVGVDIRVMIAYFGLSVGGYVRVPEEDVDPGALLSLGLVIGN